MLTWLMGRKKRCAEIAHLRDLVSQCWKRLRQDRDLLSDKQRVQFAKDIQAVQNAATSEVEDIEGAAVKLVEAHNRYFPPKSGAFWRENGEVLMVALIGAMALRAFFLQPFKIPTGSMQPTLNGITVRKVTPMDHTWWYALISRPIFGERVIHFVAEADGVFDKNSLRAVHFPPLHFGGKNGFFNILPAEGVEFEVGGVKYTYPAMENQFKSDVLGNPELEQPLSDFDRVFHKGEVLLDCVVQTGDQLFVDRFTYNFVKPKRGEVFVFDTHGLPVQKAGDFYIKRLAGVPGDTLNIDDLKLKVNGRLAQESGFQRVMSLKEGYHGYTTGVPGQRFLLDGEESRTLGTRSYFALGDNSRHSSDSRVWGDVPYDHIVGRGFFVYWPFTRHFGRVE